MLDISNIKFFTPSTTRKRASITSSISFREPQLVLRLPIGILEGMGFSVDERIKYGVHKEDTNILFFVKDKEGNKTQVQRNKKSVFLCFKNNFQNQGIFKVDASKFKSHGSYFSLDLRDQEKLILK